MNELLPFVDNPMNEDRWGDAKAIADRAGWPRRGMANTLEALERQGLVESQKQGPAPSPRSDPPPRLWRRCLRFRISVDFHSEPSVIEVTASDLKDAWSRRYELAADAEPLSWEVHPTYVEGVE